MERRVLDLGRLEAVTLTVAVHLPEQHLDFALPRHLGKLVHRGDQQRRQSAINLLVDDDNRQALVGCLAPAEQALAELVTAVGQRSAGPCGYGLASRCLPPSIALPHHGQAVNW